MEIKVYLVFLRVINPFWGGHWPKKNTQLNDSLLGKLIRYWKGYSHGLRYICFNFR